jgi:hypothetical protein
VWGKGNEGTLLVMDNPFPGIDTTKTWGFVRTQSFYWFQHCTLTLFSFSKTTLAKRMLA